MLSLGFGIKNDLVLSNFLILENTFNYFKKEWFENKTVHSLYDYSINNYCLLLILIYTGLLEDPIPYDIYKFYTSLEKIPEVAKKAFRPKTESGPEWNLKAEELLKEHDKALEFFLTKFDPEKAREKLKELFEAFE